MTTKNPISDVIRKALQASAKSRYAVSKESGVNQAALCRFVSGGGLRVESLEAIAEALGLEVVVREKKGNK